MTMYWVELKKEEILTLDALFDNEPFSISTSKTSGGGINHRVHYPLDREALEGVDGANPKHPILGYNATQFMIFAFYFERIPKEAQIDLRDKINSLNPDEVGHGPRQFEGLKEVVEAMDYHINQNRPQTIDYFLAVK
jgi:hypothetical protein